MLVLLHLLPTSYNPLRDPVSNYGVGPYRAGYRLMASLQGLAGLLMAYVLANEFTPTPLLPVIMLLVFGVARLAIAWFPTDLAGQKQTNVGKIHTVLAIIFFTSITTALISFNVGVTHEAGWTEYSNVFAILNWIAIVATLLIILSARIKKVRTYFGLWERLLYAAFIAWFLIVTSLY